MVFPTILIASPFLSVLVTQTSKKYLHFSGAVLIALGAQLLADSRRGFAFDRVHNRVET